MVDPCISFRPRLNFFVHNVKKSSSFCWPLRKLNKGEKYKDVNFQIVHSARKKINKNTKEIIYLNNHFLQYKF